MNNLLFRINELCGLNVNSFEKVIKGSLSENYVLTDGQNKYFLKKYRFDNAERIEEIHTAKKYFSDGGIPVILPIQNKEKKTYFFYNSGYYSLFPFVFDRQLEHGELTEKAIISLGKMLGQIHLLGKQAKLLNGEQFKIWDKKKSLEKIEAIKTEIEKKKTRSDFDKMALENLMTKEDLIIKNHLEYSDVNLPSDHLIHGDYLDHNVFF
jgi:Ser/Thr protein kinase RdoA (MazF antagonist)